MTRSHLIATLPAVLVCIFLTRGWTQAEPRVVTRQEVRARLDAWYAHQRRIFAAPSEPSAEFPMEVFSGPEFDALVALGPAAVPYLIEQVDRDHLVTVGYVLYKITGYRFPYRRVTTEDGNFVWRVDGIPEVQFDDVPHARMIWHVWWEDWRFRTPALFQQFCDEWQRARAAGEEEAAERVWDQIVGLGIPVLPLLVERISEGESEFIAAFSQLTHGAIAQDATPDEVVQWWEANKTTWMLPVPQLDQREAEPKP